MASSSAQDSNGALFLTPRRRVVDTDLGRVDVDHVPDDGAVKDLTERLRRLESVARRERHPPGRDLLRSQFTDATFTEHGRSLSEQPAQLVDRHLLHVVLGEIGLDQLRQRQRARDPALPADTLKLAFERLARIRLRHEPASLNSARPATADAEAVRPQSLAIASAGRQLEHLSLLQHPGITPSFRGSRPPPSPGSSAGDTRTLGRARASYDLIRDPQTRLDWPVGAVGAPVGALGVPSSGARVQPDLQRRLQVTSRRGSPQSMT
jgi:hypothetical protein